MPAGTSSKDLPDTPLAWADLTARFAGAKQASGAAIFIPRDHPDYPPTWLTRHCGTLCVGWPGVNGKTFEPGKPFHLHYRIWIHSATVDAVTFNISYEAYLRGAERIGNKFGKDDHSRFSRLEIYTLGLPTPRSPCALGSRPYDQFTTYPRPGLFRLRSGDDVSRRSRVSREKRIDTEILLQVGLTPPRKILLAAGNKKDRWE